MDIALWQIAKAERVKSLVFDHIGIAYGMKQLGMMRSGIGAGHHSETPGFIEDSMFEILKEWLGQEDSKPYQLWGRK